MSPSQDIVRPQFELRVNGIADPAIRCQMSHQEPDDFDILVDDAILGTLAITPDCVLELREPCGDWRAVTLEELKGMVVDDSEPLITDHSSVVPEMVEKQSCDLVDEAEAVHRRPSQFADLTGHADCLKRVQTLFYRAGVPHKSAGTVFVVPDVRLARAVLCKGGFHPSPISPVALVEPQTRCAVQLIEQRL
jgi:hypothetical protein